MWAALETWLLGDGAVPEARVGEVLRHTGLRLRCDALGPGAQTVRGAWAVAAAGGNVRYRLRGPVVARWRQAAVLDIGTCLVLLEPAATRTTRTSLGHDALEPFSPDFTTLAVGSVGEAVGRLEVVPDHEWDAFHPVDLRRDWRLRGVFLAGRPGVTHEDDVLAVDGGTIRGVRLERLDVAADRDPANPYLVDLEAVRDS